MPIRWKLYIHQNSIRTRRHEVKFKHPNKSVVPPGKTDGTFSSPLWHCDVKILGDIENTRVVKFISSLPLRHCGVPGQGWPHLPRPFKGFLWTRYIYVFGSSNSCHLYAVLVNKRRIKNLTCVMFVRDTRAALNWFSFSPRQH